MSLNIEQFAINYETSRKPFPPSSWKYIFKLLGLIIVADKKTLKEEVDKFLEVVVELRAIIDPSICFTDKMVLDWFRLNKWELEEIINSLAYDTALCEVLTPIKSLPQKLDVISCMVKIAVSDGVYSDLEKGLIKKTCLYWNVRSNFQPQLEYLHKPDESPKLVDHLKSHPRYDRVLETYQ